MFEFGLCYLADSLTLFSYALTESSALDSASFFMFSL